MTVRINMIRDGERGIREILREKDMLKESVILGLAFLGIISITCAVFTMGI